MAAERAIRVRAFAKINLDLRVTGRRPDGYHELRTTFQSVALHDTLTFLPARGRFRIDCDEPACPSDHTNLVWRAAAQLWKAAGRPGEVRNLTVRLQKRIPIQAGLGGGSSDAAAALRGLLKLWRVKIPRGQLRDIAADLGADVPYFLEGGTVLGLGRGDVLVPLADARRAWIVLVVPPFGVSTRDAFAWWGRPQRRRAKPEGDLHNDLQAPVSERHPEIAALVKRLLRHRARHAAMSGSGSAVFGLFDRLGDAEQATSALFDGVSRVLLTRTITRRAYRASPALAAK